MLASMCCGVKQALDTELGVSVCPRHLYHSFSLLQQPDMTTQPQVLVGGIRFLCPASSRCIQSAVKFVLFSALFLHQCVDAGSRLDKPIRTSQREAGSVSLVMSESRVTQQGCSSANSRFYYFKYKDDFLTDAAALHHIKIKLSWAKQAGPPGCWFACSGLTDIICTVNWISLHAKYLWHVNLLVISIFPYTLCWISAGCYYAWYTV